MARKKETPEAVAALDLPVSFSNVSIGDGTARVGIQIDRAKLTISKADQNLCGRRLTGKLIAGGVGDAPGQTYLPGTKLPELVGIFDVKSFSVNKKRIGAGLTFILEGLDLGLIAKFAKRSGRLVVNGVEDIPANESEEEA
jgi:hypothetical protein